MPRTPVMAPSVLAERTSALVSALTTRPRRSGAAVVNDIHSQLNATRVAAIVEVRAAADARDAILASSAAAPICIAGGWHAMGGQQFVDNGTLFDTRRFNRVLAFDAERGVVEVEAGIQWPELIRELGALQASVPEDSRWAIRQKQTGADRLSIGGALSANVHGRGLTMRPFVADIESFTLIDAAGALRRCSRTEDAELFRLAVGGYGLFGFVATVTLRLMRRRQLERVVELVDSDRAVAAFEELIAAGFLYGDFQFAIDPDSDDFLHRGILSAYRPVVRGGAPPNGQLALTPEQWRGLLLLAHVDKSRAFDLYAAHYLATSGQRYWSDLHQLSTYLDDYHVAVDAQLAARGEPAGGTEVITELFVPPERLESFLAAARDDFRRHAVNVIYGTVRLIERDEESFLPWARRRSACVIFNLHTTHTAAGLAHAADAFRRLIDLAIAQDGSYYLTYHRHARRDQVLACHPALPTLLRKKLDYDPGERFQSTWYRWYRSLLGESSGGEDGRRSAS
jgi:FAD/FMN-containing dehydrogenase